VAKLRTDLNQAHAAAGHVTERVSAAKNSVERIDYKASRARAYFDD
jgi:hypothetical protein